MNRDLDIDLRRPFVAVARLRSFMDADRAIGRTQSAVSLQIKRLKSIVGKNLIDRDHQAGGITRAGEALIVYANQIPAANDDALAHILQPEAKGLIRIAAPDSQATFFLPPILSSFAREYPLIQVELTCDKTSELLPKLGSGELDVVVATHEPTAVAGEITRFEPLQWVSSPEYSSDPDERRSLALFASGCVCRSIALKVLEQSERHWHIACSTRSVALIEQTLLAGSTVSVMEVSTIPPSLKIIDGQAGLPALRGSQSLCIDLRLARRMYDSLGHSCWKNLPSCPDMYEPWHRRGPDKCLASQTIPPPTPLTTGRSAATRTR